MFYFTFKCAICVTRHHRYGLCTKINYTVAFSVQNILPRRACHSENPIMLVSRPFAAIHFYLYKNQDVCTYLLPPLHTVDKTNAFITRLHEDKLRRLGGQAARAARAPVRARRTANHVAYVAQRMSRSKRSNQQLQLRLASLKRTYGRSLRDYSPCFFSGPAPRRILAAPTTPSTSSWPAPPTVIPATTATVPRPRPSPQGLRMTMQQPIPVPPPNLSPALQPTIQTITPIIPLRTVAHED